VKDLAAGTLDSLAAGALEEGDSGWYIDTGMFENV
jgi:hypothetical protein